MPAVYLSAFFNFLTVGLVQSILKAMGGGKGPGFSKDLDVFVDLWLQRTEILDFSGCKASPRSLLGGQKRGF